MKKHWGIFSMFIVAIIIVLLIIFLPRKTDYFRSYKQIKKSGELHVAVNCALDNTGYNATYEFQYELIEFICDSLHLRPVFIIENSLEKNIEALKSGKIDMIGNTMPITSAMRQQMLFSHPIFQSKIVLVQRKAEANNDIQPLRDPLELAEKTIWIQSNSPDKLRLNNLSKEIGNFIHIAEMPDCSADTLIDMVAKGKIDFTVCSDLLTASVRKNYPEIDVETAIGFPQICAWAFNKKSGELQCAVNSYLEKFIFKN